MGRAWDADGFVEGEGRPAHLEEESGQGRADPPDPGELFAAEYGVVECQRGPGDDSDVEAGLENDPGGVRVDVKVELGGGGDVAAAVVGAAHDDQLIDVADERWIPDRCHRDVGQWADGHHRYLARGLRGEANQRVDGVLRLGGGAIEVHGESAGAIAVYVLRRHPWHNEGPVAAEVDRHVAELGRPRSG